MNRLYLESLSFIDLPSASLACMDIFCIFMHYAASLCHILIRRFGRVQKGTCPTPGKIWSKDGQVEGDWRGWNMLKHWTIRRGSQDTTHFKTVLCHCYTHFLSFFGIGQILFKHWIHDAITPNCFKWFHRRLSYIMFIIYHIYHISIEHRKMLRAVCVCEGQFRSVSLNLKWILQVCSMAQLHWEGLNTVSQDTKHRLTRTLHRLCGVEPCSTFGFAQPARIHLLMKVQMVKVC